MPDNPTARKDYEALRLAQGAVADALMTASHIAGRAADCFDGADACQLFSDLRNAIANFKDDNPEMVAVRGAMWEARRAL